MAFSSDFFFEDYFIKTFQILCDYEFLFNFANTEILTKDILTKVKAWLRTFNENNQNDYEKLLGKILELSNHHITIFKPTENPHLPKKGHNFKKSHEIDLLSNAIANMSKKCNLNSIVDLGSGLGYLSLLLNERFQFNVIGIEADEKRVETAKARQNNSHISVDKVKYFQHFVTDKSEKFLNEVTKGFLEKDENYLICGLHACADLTIDAIKLFMTIKNCKGLAIMPCCYHKLKFKNNSQEFINIPLSKSMLKVHEEFNGSEYIRRPFLRLACQRSCWSTNTMDQSNDNRIFHLMSRATLELYACKENLRLVKKKCKSPNVSDFESYLNNTVLNGYKLVKKNSDAVGNIQSSNALQSNYGFAVLKTEEGSSGTSAQPEAEVGSENNAEQNTIDVVEFDLEKLRELWKGLKDDDFEAAAILLKCQDSLQAMCENLILLDRVAFMLEQSREMNLDLSVELMKVADEKISPRCFAIVASKK